MIWNCKKIGRVFRPDGSMDWMRSHASHPVAWPLGEGFFRIYFGTRGAGNQTQIAWVKINIADPLQVLEISQAPVVNVGEPGLFDDSGVSMGSLCRAEDGELRLYYLGWNLGITVPWRNTIGLAVSNDGGETFKKHSNVPVLDRNPLDPVSMTYPWVVRFRGRWRMWYGTNTTTGPTIVDWNHGIRSAWSDDGIHWQPEPSLCVCPRLPDEIALVRPCIFSDRDGKLHLWFSSRRADGRFHLGCASSHDGERWTREDENLIFAQGTETWDDRDHCYCSVFLSAGKTYALYNGNDYGREGFGIAEVSNQRSIP